MQLQIVSPKPGSAVVYERLPHGRVQIRARVLSGSPSSIATSPDGPFGSVSLTYNASHGLWEAWAKDQAQNDPGRHSWTVVAKGGAGGPPLGSAQSTNYFFQRYDIVARLGRADAAGTLGCNPCKIKDRARDARNGGADITGLHRVLRRRQGEGRDPHEQPLDA